MKQDDYNKSYFLFLIPKACSFVPVTAIYKL